MANHKYKTGMVCDLESAVVWNSSRVIKSRYKRLHVQSMQNMIESGMAKKGDLGYINIKSTSMRKSIPCFYTESSQGIQMKSIDDKMIKVSTRICDNFQEKLNSFFRNEV